ncbi:TRAP transporter small permease [Salinispirillum marinum]|uniref:TRAP transporter small permease protein n=2 Tax=Saccharospirillaceae TaxID=255527 RepID=A0ABV8BFF0_9GAMM
MNALFRFSDRITVVLALLGTLGIVAMMLHVTLDVVLRSAFNVSAPATLELVTRYYMVLLALLPLGWVERQRQMISVELFTDLMPQALQRWNERLVTVLSILIYAVFALATWEKAVEQYQIGAYVMSLDTRIPVWPSYFVLPVSFTLAAYVCLMREVQAWAVRPDTATN